MKYLASGAVESILMEGKMAGITQGRKDAETQPKNGRIMAGQNHGAESNHR